jgi:hypothetical protein
MKGNLLKIKAIKANREWCDKDHVLLCACFQILVDFIEKEKPDKIIDVIHNKKQKRMWKELKALYRYWKIGRPKMEKEEQKALMKWSKTYEWKTVPDPNGGPFAYHVTLRNDKRLQKLHWRLEDKLHKQEDEMLQRLINIRHHLWC